MGYGSMQKFSVPMTMLFVLFSAAACQTPAALTEPCDVLVVIPDAKPSTNSYLVKNDRPVAVGLARNKLRVDKYGCRTK